MMDKDRDGDTDSRVNLDGRSAGGPDAAGRQPLLMADARIRRVQAKRLVGMGRLAEVWQAYSTELHQDVALKVLHPDWVRDEAVAKELATLAKNVMRLQHPNIVEIVETGEHEGLFYMVTEWMRSSLSQKLRQRDNYRLRRALPIVAGAVEGLAHARHAGIAHGDVSPDNIMIDWGGSPKVCDFGITMLVRAYLDKTGEDPACGNPDYMAPEAAASGQFDHRSDIYSLGITLYRMLTGELPYRANTPQELLRKHLLETLPRHPALVDQAEGRPYKLVYRMTEKDPGDRFEDYDELRAELKELELLAAGETEPSGCGHVVPSSGSEPQATAGAQAPQAAAPPHAVPAGDDDSAAEVQDDAMAPGAPVASEPVAAPAPAQTAPAESPAPADTARPQQASPAVPPAESPAAMDVVYSLHLHDVPTDVEHEEEAPPELSDSEYAGVAMAAPAAVPVVARRDVETRFWAAILVGACGVAVLAVGFLVWTLVSAKPASRRVAAAPTPSATPAPAAPATPVATVAVVPTVPRSPAQPAMTAAAPSPAATLPPASAAVPPMPLAGQDIVIDDGQPGAVVFQPKEAWFASSERGRSNAGNSMIARIDGNEKSATFFSPIPRAGRYEVLMYWIHSGPEFRSRAVPVYVHTASGAQRVTVDQVVAGSRFISIGKFEFPAGAQMPILTVTTQNLQSSGQACVSVDAVRLRPLP